MTAQVSTTPVAVRLVPVEALERIARSLRAAHSTHGFNSYSNGLIAAVKEEVANLLAAAPVAPAGSDGERTEADAALADLGMNLARNLADGHFAMSDAVQMIEGLATRLAARAQPPAGEAFVEAGVKRILDIAAGRLVPVPVDEVDCDACGGSGKIVEEARTTGANQHSACQRDCDECDGTGFIAHPAEPAALLRNLPDRLRRQALNVEPDGWCSAARLMREAADEIEQARALRPAGGEGAR